MTDLRALAERLAAATGSDRDLDVDLGLALNPEFAGGHRSEHGVSLVDVDYATLAVPRYTSSLDAVVALVERLRPDEDDFHVGRVQGEAFAWIEGTNGYKESHAPTAPLALLRALVASMIEEAERG